MTDNEQKPSPVRFVSVLGYDGSFRENFDAVRCALDQALPDDRYEVVFAEYYEKANQQLLGLAGEHENLRIVTLGNVHPGKDNEYHLGACANAALRQARGDLIVFPDADVMFERDFLEEVVRQHERQEDVVLYFYRMDEPATDSPAPRTVEDLKRVCELSNPTNFGGCLTVRKKWLEAINGYDQHPVWRGYTASGMDTAMRLRALGLCIRWHPSKFIYHGHHPGTRAPDPVSRMRGKVQRDLITSRARALETLPLIGLDPDRKPRWPTEPPVEPAPEEKPGPPQKCWKDAVKAVARTVVPAFLRHKIIAVLSDS